MWQLNQPKLCPRLLLQQRVSSTSPTREPHGMRSLNYLPRATRQESFLSEETASLSLLLITAPHRIFTSIQTLRDGPACSIGEGLRFPSSTTFFRPICPPTKIHNTHNATGKQKKNSVKRKCLGTQTRTRPGLNV
jgi:hypothetical protein